MLRVGLGSYPIGLWVATLHYARYGGSDPNIATSASDALLNPYPVTVLMVSALAIVTGFAERVAVFVKDLRYRRIHNRNG